MATIAANNPSSILKIKEFLGLNQNPDGDTNIRNGELAEMRNFKITRDKHLQIRPGTKTLMTIRDAWEQTGFSVENPKLTGTWYGKVGEAYHLLVAFGGILFDVDKDNLTAKSIGSCTQDGTTFFGFEGNVYLLNGHEYMFWDGKDDTQFKDVEPYVPTVLTAASPLGQGTSLENVNRLTNKRIAQYSADGTSKDYYLPESEVKEVLSVEGTTATYTLDAAKGKVTFSTAPSSGVNNLKITYTKGDGALDEVKKMRFAELFNGTTDSRIFLYGDGSNKTIYSGVNHATGKPDASYFPDLYEASVGEANTPITAMIRHYSRLLVFKSASCWSMQYEITGLATGGVTAAFYVTPVNRQIGNSAYGQVQLLENNPLTLFEESVYQWRATSSSGNITADNRNANRISDRVATTIREFDLEKTKVFNRLTQNEYWFLYGGTALILNYAADAWYRYTNMNFVEMVEISGQLYGFREDGSLVHISREYRSDDGADIDAYAATGSMDFDKEWLVKYSPMIFVAIQPESGARINVTVETNRRSDYPEKTVAASLATFLHVDFNHFSFNINRKPQVRRVKMKVKKATFYQLVFKSLSSSATATILETDVQLRYGGNVK